MDIKRILEKLPHRYPMLLVDRVLEVQGQESIVALKNVSMNEPFFQGHFPEYPVMPGVLILEALAQAAGILSFSSTPDEKRDENTVYYFVGIDNARFKRPVMPGDQLMLYVSVERCVRGIWKYKAQAKVDGNVVCEADLMCTKREISK